MKNIPISKIKPFHKKIQLSSSPIRIYKKLYSNENFSFIYESLESIGKRGRYSFIGANPFIVFTSWAEEIEIKFMNEKYRLKGNPLKILRDLMNDYEGDLHVPPFCGGALGYMTYDSVRYFEKIPDTNPHGFKTPEMFFIFPKEIIIFDHKENTLDIVVYSAHNAQNRVEELRTQIEGCKNDTVFNEIPGQEKSLEFESNFTEDSFKNIVRRAKEYIIAGDIFQVVLSQRLTFEVDTDPFSVYRALRLSNPSPYMYYLNFDGLFILGSSPEILVKLTDGVATTRPLAGTRPRGKALEEDVLLEVELTNNEKERAEHVMLVDLSRNDMGRVCKKGSVRVTELLGVEKFSRVMHLVSNVVGQLQDDKDGFNLIESTFPAGTVSGAPKIRAMEIIDELESIRRGIYAGAIGYFDFSGNMDFCIAIRMIVIKNKMGIIQAGAGIVADSVPEREYQETLNKAKALINAVEMRGDI